MTQEAGPPATEGASQDSTSKPSADAPAGERITPALWMPAAPTMAWLAFGSAETDWDRAFYFGASIWYAADPERVLDWLNEVAEDGYLVPEFEQSADVKALHRHINGAAYALAKGKRRAPSEDNIRQAARDLHAILTSRIADATAQHAAIWEASETLRRALARGDLTACGWQGHDPTIDEDASAPPPLRETIPRDIFSRPVTVTQAGVLGFARGDGSWGYDFETLWSGLLFDSADLLALSPRVEDDRPAVPYTAPVPELPRDRGGRPPVHTWPPFDAECRRYLLELIDKEADGDLPRELRRHMRWWACQNMKATKPRRETISDRVAEVYGATMKARAQQDET